MTIEASQTPPKFSARYCIGGFSERQTLSNKVKRLYE